MKCDNLQRYSVEIDYVPNDDGAYMDADEVDAAIAELKAKLEDVQASMYADVVDANMENRKLKRALWLCRYGMARMQYLMYRNMNATKDMLYWYDKQKIFRAKAEEYK